jgi:hypothetical protein
MKQRKIAISNGFSKYFNGNTLHREIHNISTNLLSSIHFAVKVEVKRQLNKQSKEDNS